MRIVGMFCLGFGIVFLFFPIILVLTHEGEVASLLLLVGSVWIVALPLAIVGIFLTCRSEEAGPEDEADSSAALLDDATSAISGMSAGPFPVDRDHRQGSAMDRLHAFDLSSLTVAGWLLVLATVVFFQGELLLFRLLVPHSPEELGPLVFLALLAGGALAIGFFSVGRLCLKVLGVAFNSYTRRSLSPSWATRAIDELRARGDQR